MTQPAPVRPDATPPSADRPTATEPSVRGRSVRRRVTTGTGATLALAVASVTGAATAHADEQYTVRAGDTVSHIALRSGTSVGAIARANSLPSAGAIRIGQTLTIPSATAPAAAPAPAAPAATGTYTVRSGDTVSGIAAQHRTTVAAVVAANGLDARALIRIGQRLTIPGAAGATAPAPAPAPAAPAATGTYTVRSGDTVSGIAAQHRTTVAAVVAANGLDARALIRIGQRLTIPGAAGATAPAPAPAPAAPAATGTYTVRSGDTVSGIAAQHRTTVAAVVAANGLDARASIRIGQKLRLPGATAPAATPTTQLVGNTFAGRTYSSSVVASANLNKATLLAMGVPSKSAMQAKVVSTARALGVDPALAQAIAFQESGFNQTAVSPANAIGTMQCIPSTGVWVGQMVGRPLNLLDPDDNVTCGVGLLRHLVRTSPDLPTAIAGYYQGAASVKRNGMFADTRRYVAAIQTHMTRFR
ncbi:LysM peptidoglycan-binding domain-containing protein [Cellulomonas sp. ATA003]|uniref:LysM peptidoglycan-binding domain-containing protein n=1 Tax=Cellulomonas sp. ATA003 TaxID=3073064 RepID=UPI002873D2F1|nr:LysM peptidoglycan-binding domain-containing protein [Cellulomonas sp. ATA003]WNB84454.1 LysM peptidoglycan-binding domain-containing protein [Cellulomonas sp. ATA003]